jgi:uncharacterized surface anchored protein
VPSTEQSSTTSVVVEAPITTTTVHDHSSHSHEPNLPQTGAQFLYRVLLSVYAICFGFFLIIFKKAKQK